MSQIEAPVSAVLTEAASAAVTAYQEACSTASRAERRRKAGIGADGTETYWLDEYVEAPVLKVVERHGCNVLSEEIGWIDQGSAATVVIDPVDGTSNASSGVPLSAFAAALVVDDTITESLLVWLDTGRTWWATQTDSSALGVADTTALDGATVSMLRPRPTTLTRWTSVAERVERVRILGSSVLESAFVADGAIDAFFDPGGDVHRIVDIAAGALLVEQAGGVVVDAQGRPFSFAPDLSLRWSGVFAATPQLAEEICGELVA